MEGKMENLLTIAHVVLDDEEKIHFTSLIERLQNVQKCAGVKRVRLLFFIIKYANLLSSSAQWLLQLAYCCKVAEGRVAADVFS